ncbi:hypothetical protein HD599_002790 [Conyzicola lurida]|uniref:Uncharacterized protein n=2 Tax=Conyzicola lurida TaxID=1172621 RepID=A0A841AMQ0_9MICO|nr:hypothetical protein [Conyzicola lurida]
MMGESRSAQELDPLGGITARLLVIIAVAVAYVVAVSESLNTLDQISTPAFEVAALLSFGAAGVYYIRATSPFRAPFPRLAHAVVCALSLLAVLFNSLAQWGTNEVVRDDWAPVTLAILLFTFGSYIPAREILACTLVSALLIGGLAYLQADTFAADVPAAVFAILPATPVLACGLAASVFASSLVRSILDWRAAASAPAAADIPEPPVHATASHLVHLERQVLPFLQRVSTETELTDDDGERARLLARELRTLMVLDAERSWLMRLVHQTTDPQRYADRMTAAERGYVRAVVSHLRGSEAFKGDRMRLTLDGTRYEASCTIAVDRVAGSNPRVQLAPYIAVGRSVFDSVAWRLDGDILTVTLTFDPTANEEQQ